MNFPAASCRGSHVQEDDYQEDLLMKRTIALFTLVLFLAVLAGCHHRGFVPPGQIKKQSAPGQMKKHQ